MSWTSVDQADFEKFIKLLCIKSTQIIVQGRIGKSISTPCSAHSGSEWIMFNLAIKDYPDIDREAKAAISKGIPNANNSYVIEISLRTSDADALVLEVWSIGFINKSEELHIRQEVYNRISLLLKSLLCVSRITPAYKLSRRQGGDFVICYRVYMGQINLSGLGDGFKTLRVGAVGTPFGTFTMSAAYRTTENLHLTTQQISPEAVMPFELYDDHFAMNKPHRTSAAKPCRTLQSRLRTLSENSDMQTPTIETSPSYNTFNASFSPSPGRPSMERGENEATFTVGTPPNHISTRRSASSPTFERSRRIVSSPTEKSAFTSGKREIPASYISQSKRIKATAGEPPAIPTSTRGPCGDGFYQISPARRNCLINVDPFAGSSAPSRPIQYWHYGTSPKGHEERLMGTSPLAKTPPGVSRKSSCPTTFHWSNSNVTMVTTDGRSDKAESERSNPNKVRSMLPGLHMLANSPPPVCETGAFVRSVTKDEKDRVSSPFLATSSLPFIDLISAIDDEDDDDTASSCSTEMNTDSIKRLSKISLDHSHGSSSTMSSKTSMDNQDDGKQHGDDFVMVDLNPAFVRDNSVEDLAAFYQICKNPLQLCMFEENRGLETAETMQELTKEFEDLKNNIEEFDLFVKEITTTETD